MSEPATQRIDRWLWHARVVKTRSLATQLVAGGQVRIDGNRVSKPAHMVRAEQVLTIVLPQGIKVLKIVGFAERRGSATIAATLYEDLTPELPKPPRDFAAGPVPGPRPDRRERRKSAKIRGKPLN